ALIFKRIGGSHAKVTSQFIDIVSLKKIALNKKEQTIKRNGMLLSFCKKIITGAIVVINNPTMTGRKFFRTRSMTDTPQNPAMAISDDQATIVPPPVQMEPI